MSAETPFNSEDFGKTVESFDQPTEIKHLKQSNQPAEKKEISNQEQAITEAFELAKVQLQLAETVELAREITQQYYEKLRKYEDVEKRLDEKTESDVFILDNKPYSLIRATGGVNRLRLKLLPDFSVGEQINVLRSSGEVDWNWKITEITSDGKAIVEKIHNERTLRKTVNLKILHSWNNERNA